MAAGGVVVTGAPPGTPLSLVQLDKIEDEKGLWLRVKIDGELFGLEGPFATQAECDRAFNDLLEMMLDARGAVPVPPQKLQ